MSERWYKVLTADQSCHGGTHTWSLPKPDGTPGDWHEIPGELKVCESGFHVTNRPAAWMGPDRSVYEVETEGPMLCPYYGCPGPWDISPGSLARMTNMSMEEMTPVVVSRLNACLGPDALQKVAAKKCRLLRKLEADELTALHVYSAGVHHVPEDVLIFAAYGTAKVTVSAVTRAHVWGGAPWPKFPGMRRALTNLPPNRLGVSVELVMPK